MKKKTTNQLLEDISQKLDILIENKKPLNGGGQGTPIMAGQFIFSDFFKDGDDLWVYGLDNIRAAYPNPIPYKSIDTLELAFDLEKSMYDSEIIKKLGGEEKVRETAVTMDQIEQLIKNQQGGKAGVMLTSGFANIFYVIGKNNQLFAVRVYWRSVGQRWDVLGYELDEYGPWGRGYRVFSNKILVS